MAKRLLVDDYVFDLKHPCMTPGRRCVRGSKTDIQDIRRADVLVSAVRGSCSLRDGSRKEHLAAVQTCHVDDRGYVW